MHPEKVNLPHRAHRSSFALIATLALVAVATILLVLFVTSTSLDRTASYSYSQSIRADQLGLGGLHLVVSQLQAEMSKDQLPDTNYPGAASYYAPIFTNVTSANLAPQANVTNSALPIMVKMSTNATPFYVGSLVTGGLQASSISTTTPSLNYRSVSTNIWNQAYFGQFPNTVSAPYWILMTRSGPSSGSALTFGATGNTVNNPVTSNTNYVLGRIAYAVYDESGLLDVTAAGYDPTQYTSAAQLATIKGTLAGADLTQVGITSPSTFVQWRNAATAVSTNTYNAYITNFAATNGFLQVAQGDTTILGRQDLIKAALYQTNGLTTSVLTNLTTFTRELNAPSWAPSVAYTPTTAKYKYVINALSTTNSPSGNSGTGFTAAAGKANPNPFIPLVRYTGMTTSPSPITGYNANGTTYTYSVQVGDSVVQHRFPLDRLNWITPKGPSASLATTDAFYNAGGTQAAIQACFGLYWGPSENITGDANWTGINVWRYVGSVGTATAATKEKIAAVNSSVVETLVDVGAETTAREPNFFELLQAGIFSGSIALSTGSASELEASGEAYLTLQLLRIGANIIAQVQPQAYPITIEYNENDGGNFSVDASGVANLPYLNMLKFITGQSPTDSGSGGVHQMGVYGIFGLWNPHQQPPTAVTRPPIALFIQGGMSVGSGWSYQQGGYSTTAPLDTGVYGKSYTTVTANTYYLPLSTSAGVGANGFLNPYPITSGDIGTPVGGNGSSTALGWTSTTSTFVASGDPDYAYLNGNGLTYEAFELPDLTVNLGLGASGPMGATGNNPTHDLVYLGQTPLITSLPSFQIILKYQDPVNTSKWVPYDYWIGYNSSLTSWPAAETDRDCYYGPNPGGGSTPGVTAATAPPTLHDVLHSNNAHSTVWLTTDPRTMRFGTFPFAGDTQNAANGILANAHIESLWSGTPTGTGLNPNTSPPFNISGYANRPGGLGTTGIPGEGGAFPASFNGFYVPADLSRNNYANTLGGASAGSFFSAYADLDGIQRVADSGLFSTSAIFPFSVVPNTGNPYYDPNDVPTPNSPSQRTADRPIILNRPFTSVGELGYVYRDSPWRTLDFFSVSPISGLCTSPDSGLLDLFCVTDSPNNVVAGRINLNTRNTAMITAVLNSSLANTGDTVNNTSVSSLANASAMASAINTYTSTTPFINKDQLVTGFGPTLGGGTTVNTAFATADEQNVKPYREAYVRALSAVGQTRTWNLMIDLIAQSGKYPPNLAAGSSLGQFEVDGERHYWLHIAIDRFTGKVVDRQLELIGP